jgi:hypothetical protein
MPISIARTLAGTVFFLPIAAASLAAAGGVSAVETPGSGTLTMCRSRLVYSDCNSYHHIAIPQRIAVGDTVSVAFGSNPKEYAFPIARILQTGDACTLLSHANGDTDKTDKIEVASCKAASGSK